MNYNEAVEILTSQAKFQIKLGLERVQKILKLLDNPQENLKIIHIAGTNGKGSVASTLAKILEYSGAKTGLYTSPHLIKYTERIKINSNDISEDNFALYIEEVCNVADKNNIDLTEFEILTVCAYKYFSDKKVDYAVIETGMGGRFDATNTVKMPLLEIITSISLDHIDRLGDTTDKIAYEKAGIIKDNSTVIISANNAGYIVTEKYAAEHNAVVIKVSDNVQTHFENGQNYILYDNQKYKFSLLGTYQNQNMALVLSACKFLNIPEIAIKKGLANVKWHARLEYIKEKNLIIDGAHNPDAAAELRKSLDLYFPKQKRIFIYSTLNTKDYCSIAKILFRNQDEIYYYEFDHKNAVSYEEYHNKINWLKINKIDNLKEIFSEKELKIICGSLYMIGEITSQDTSLLA